MSYRSSGRGLLGLVVIAVLGLMAFAGSAHAVTPLFNVGNSTALHASFSAVQEEPAVFLIPALNFEIKCPEMELKEGLVLAGGQLVHIRLLYKECKVFEFGLPLAEIGVCHVSDVLDDRPELLHITFGASALPVEFASGDYGILVENILAEINFLPGTGCPLPLKNILKGEICGLIEPLKNDTTKPLVLFSQALQGTCPERVLEALGNPAGLKVKDKLLFGLNEAFLDSRLEVFMVGAHAGMTFGVLLL